MKVRIKKNDLGRLIEMYCLEYASNFLPDSIVVEGEAVEEKPTRDCVAGCRAGYHYCGQYGSPSKPQIEKLPLEALEKYVGAYERRIHKIEAKINKLIDRENERNK